MVLVFQLLETRTLMYADLQDWCAINNQLEKGSVVQDNLSFLERITNLGTCILQCGFL